MTFDLKRDEVSAQRKLLALARNVAKLALISLAVAGAYALGSVVGFCLTPKGSPIATYWPANAILMASLLLTRPRRWWALTVAVLAAHLLVQNQIGIPIRTALGWFVGNTSEALLGAALLYGFNQSSPLFYSIRSTLVFLLFGVLLAPLVTSFLDASVVVITHWGRNFWVLWTTRLFSNMLAALTLVPTIVTFGTGRLDWLRRPKLPRAAEASALCLLLVGVTIWVYGRLHPLPGLLPVLVYAPLPLLLWASLRFGTGTLSASVSIIALISFRYVARGRGPFASPFTAENIMFLQMLLIVVTVPLLLLDTVLSERRRAENLLRESRTSIIGAQERERRRIASELHDDIGQRLSLVQLELSRLGKVADVAARIDLKSSVTKAVAQINDISEATRDLSHGLHPVQLEYLGLMPALRSFCGEIQESTPLEISIHEADLPQELDTDTSLCLFRVAQEALHNVVTHSQAKKARLEVAIRNGQLQLRVIDDGIGFLPGRTRTPCLGLVNMRERLKSVAGEMKIISGPSKGTIIEASVPIDRKSRL